MDTLAKDQPVIDLSIDAEAGAAYSLFVFGAKQNATYIFHRDLIPSSNSDSLTYVRIANLNEGQELAVNIKGEPLGSFINALPYKGLSDFAALPANKTVSQYIFEFRDQHSGALISTYEANGINDFSAGAQHRWFNKANTLVLAGQRFGIGANQPNVVFMNHR